MISSLIAWSPILQQAEHWAIYPGVASFALSSAQQGLGFVEENGGSGGGGVMTVVI